MSAMHANVHVVEHAPAHQRAAQVEVRDHRDAKLQPIVRDHRDAKPQPIVRDHRDDDRRVQVQRTAEVDHRSDRDRDRARPVIVESAPVVVTGTAYTAYNTGWTASPSYTYQPQPLSLMGATPLGNGQLAIDTANGLGGANSLQIDNAGSGSTYVTQVIAYDANGNYQVMNVNQMISPQNPTVQLALDNGASITKIVIDGHSDWGGEIAVQAT
jgi:hypothetical protein